MMSEAQIETLLEEMEELRSRVCDRCPGTGQVIVDGEPEACICLKETQPYRELLFENERLHERLNVLSQKLVEEKNRYTEACREYLNKAYDLQGREMYDEDVWNLAQHYATAGAAVEDEVAVCSAQALIGASFMIMWLEKRKAKA